ncbi:minor tail protein [Bacillus phage vB_BceS_LY1]|uniref:Minor tail protein n=1 Tax=Bacillus phage vB_BceS_LY1 TaxID=2950459 RepID=A0A9Y1CX93_9CAUD|nr:minor tail protein [Bacillus phage vB_BceS_LY1]
MISLARNGYTEKEVKQVLHGALGTRSVSFRYELLNKNNVFKSELFNITSAAIDYGVFNDIRRTAKFRLQEFAAIPIDFLSDRIRPVMIVDMPAMNGKAKGKIEFPLGVFIMASPERIDEDNGITRDIEAYDLSLILVEDKVTDMYTVTAGTNYKDAIVEILRSAGITDYAIEDINKTVPRDLQFEVGTSKYAIINSLATNINYTPILVDVNGTFTCRPYVLPQDRSVDYVYDDSELSIIMRGVSEELDTFNIPNRWIIVRTNSEEEPLRSVYTNTSPDSPTSTVNRGRVIADYRELEDIADQAALDDYTKRIASNASQVFGKSKFTTALMPMHDYHDVIQLKYSKLGIDDKYTETAWSMQLVAGGTMTHEIRKVVNV